MKAENTENLKKTRKRKEVIKEVENNNEIVIEEKPKKVLIQKEIDLAKSIMDWKEKYKKVFRTNICGDNYIWKPISRAEYIAISEIDGDKDLQTIKTSLLYPSFDEYLKRAEELAGLQISLMEEILSGSGFKANSFLL